MKILLVDDDAFLRDMYAAKFREGGDEVVIAKQATDALTALDETKVDIVLMDMVMPGMTGVELIKAIKSHENVGAAKCVVLSNQSEETDIAKATAAGADGYIIKAELIPSEVVAKVHELVQ